MCKKFLAVLLGTLCIGQSSLVCGAVLDYTEVLKAAEEQKTAAQTFETDDGSGNAVKIVACQDTLYVTAKSAAILSCPGENGEELAEVTLGDSLTQVGACDNGYSKISMEKDGKTINGYIQNQTLSDTEQIEAVEDEGTVEVKTDSDILDYPGKRDGEVVGEVLELDEVLRTATVGSAWSQIVYQDSSGSDQLGYIPTTVLDLPDEEAENEDTIDETLEAGTIHESTGEGVFSDALEAGTTVSEENGVLVGTPVAVSSDTSLKSLGIFKITHYCQCSICCGPYANGITSTGVTATTNHTIAVDPTQIPYGSQVVINGQVYVAEDCGGAIKTNCIDIYVASHAEGESKGVYYTEVYLVQ